MKKAISIILVLTMLLSLIACSNKTPESSESNTEASQNTTLNETTEGEISEFVPPENYATVLLVTINPQIRLYLNADGNVLAVEAVNKDAKKIVEQLTVEEAHYTEAIEKIVSNANESDFIKSTTVVHIEISETKDNPVDKDEILNEISEVVNQVVPDLKLQVKVKVKENQSSDETTATTSPATEETTVPTTESTTPPTGDPAPTQCSHTYKAATCTAPKTCSKCGATEGSALGHNYIEGVCTRCSQQQENYHALNTGGWTVTKCSPVLDFDAYIISINFKDSFLSIGYGADINNLDPDFKNDLLEAYNNGDTSVKLINGVYYYFGAGDGGSITYTESGNAISVNCEDYIHFTFERISGNQLKITGVQEADLANLIGTVLTWYSN